MEEATTFVEIAQMYGPFAAVAGYLIYQLRRDYTGICRRHNEVEDTTRNILVDCVNNATRVNEQNVEVMKRCIEILDNISQKLD